MWGFPSLDTLAQDIRYGARLLRRSPTVTIASILSLAIGIGASAGVFSLADAMLLQSLPVRAPEELLVFQWRSGPRYPFRSLSGTSWGDDTSERSTSFSLNALRQSRLQGQNVVDVFGFADLDRANVSVNGIAELGEATAVSGNYFNVLGLSPAQGRLLVDSDDRAEAPPAAVISDTLWRKRFNGTPDAIGATLAVNGAPFTVVGVTPASFHGTGQVGSSPDVYVPLTSRGQICSRQGEPDRSELLVGSHDGAAQALARIPSRPADGWTPSSSRRVRSARPEISDKDLPRVEAIPGARGQVQVRDRMREPLRMMSIVVAIVLLVACANVANLLLARGRARARELSVRIALGAPRRRVVRQLLTEGVILAACGSAFGLLGARWIAGSLLPALAIGPDPPTITAGLKPSSRWLRRRTGHRLRRALCPGARASHDGLPAHGRAARSRTRIRRGPSAAAGSQPRLSSRRSRSRWCWSRRRFCSSDPFDSYSGSISASTPAVSSRSDSIQS